MQRTLRQFAHCRYSTPVEPRLSCADTINVMLTAKERVL